MLPNHEEMSPSLVRTHGQELLYKVSSADACPHADDDLKRLVLDPLRRLRRVLVVSDKGLIGSALV